VGFLCVLWRVLPNNRVPLRAHLLPPLQKNNTNRL
jgi:hypothetical protein